jgi:hypothetical protein
MNQKELLDVAQLKDVNEELVYRLGLYKAFVSFVEEAMSNGVQPDTHAKMQLLLFGMSSSEEFIECSLD